MSLGYQVAYRLGVTPWERAGEGGALQLGLLLDREEAERSRPPGRALDLGCGTGNHTRELAARGWDAVGVDVVETALVKARAREGDTGARFVAGDVTRLHELELGSFDFFLDIGCFHGLSATDRPAMASAVSAAANPGATLLTLCFTRRPVPLLPSGASRDDLAAAYEGWTVVDQEPADTTGLPGPLKKAAPAWYRLVAGAG
jgi:SAM-dependent methyltransferase